MGKQLIFIIVLLMSTKCFADADTGCTKPLNLKYSFRDLYGLQFTTVDPSEFNDTCIKGTNFYQQAKDTDVEVLKDVFPSDITGVEFVRCNLDNVKIPAGATVDGTSINRRLKIQNDLEDWILDNDKKPVEPISKEIYIKKNISIDPADIPAEKLSELITK